jgi:hypothetical protein
MNGRKEKIWMKNENRRNLYPDKRYILIIAWLQIFTMIKCKIF